MGEPLRSDFAKKRPLGAVTVFLIWLVKFNYMLSENFIPPDEMEDHLEKKSAIIITKVSTKTNLD